MSNVSTQLPLLNIEQEIEINAAPGDVYRGLIAQLKSLDANEPGKTLDFELEEWPGGRWFRDLGNGSGHLWGFVQSIKPPHLLEIYGPMMMSFATANNLIIRIEPIANGAKVTLRHQCLGDVPEQYRDGMPDGWAKVLEGTKKRAEA